MCENSSSTTGNALGVEYSEVFIGDCGDAVCERPATVRVFEDFVLCALHHLRYELGEEVDRAGLALELVKPWRSHAKMHDLKELAATLEDIEEREEARLRLVEAWIVAVDRAEKESDPVQTRREMGKRERERAGEGEVAE